MTSFLYGLFYFLSGLYLTRGEALVVNFAYPDELAKSEEMESEKPDFEKAGSGKDSQKKTKD